MYIDIVWVDDERMAKSGLSEVPPAVPRRSAEERRHIVEETLESGSSMACATWKYGIKANLVFMWRRLYRSGLLVSEPSAELKLLPVRVLGNEPG